MCFKVLLVDDHAIVRQGIRYLLSNEDDIEIVGEADDGLEGVKMAHQLNPDVVIMDISMPNLNGIESTKKIKATTPKIKVIMLSAYRNRRFVSESIKAGANGYVSKDCVFNELYDAIKIVVGGKSYISPSIASVLLEDYIEKSSSGNGYSGNALNSREKQVLQMLAEGKNSKEIAKNLEVSSKTVDASRRHIMEKLNKHSLAELTKFAIREGLTTLEF